MEFSDTLKLEYICEKLTIEIADIKRARLTEFMKHDKKLSSLLEYVNKVLRNNDIFIENPPKYDDLFPDEDTDK